MDDNFEKVNKIGRRIILNHDKIHEVLFKYQHEIILTDNKILPANDELWQKITEEIGYQNWIKKSHGKNAYSYLVNNVEDIRTKLCPGFNQTPINCRQIDSNVSESLLQNSTLESSTDFAIEIAIRIPFDDFQKLINEKTIEVVKKRKKMKKVENSLNTELFKEFMDKKLAEKSRRVCDYMYRSRGIHKSKTSGYVVGTCKQCHSRLNCFLAKDDRDLMTITCEIKEGKGPACGKRLTNTISSLEKNAKITATQPQSTCAAENSRASSYIDRDPIRALEILKATNMKNDIMSVRRYPIGVEFCTNHQKTIYRTFIKHKNATIVILINDSLIEPIRSTFQEVPVQIIHFQAIAQSSVGAACVSQYSTAVMDTHLISHWLINWIEGLNLISPRRIIIEGMSELAIASIRAFSNFSSLSDYTNGFFENETPPSFCIKVHLFIMLRQYAILLLNENREIAIFFLRGIAKLSTCQKKLEAEVIVRALFTVACSSTRSEPTAETKSVSDIVRTKLDKITCHVLAELEIDERKLFQFSEDELISIPNLKMKDPGNCNSWAKWASSLKKEAEEDVKELPGEFPSRWFNPKFAEQLQADLGLFPIWSVLDEYREVDHSGPISINGAMEEMETVQNNLRVSRPLPIRIDDFVQLHVNYVNGTLNEESTASSAPSAPPYPEHFDPQRDTSTATGKCNVCKKDVDSLGAAKCVICFIQIHSFSPCSIPIATPESEYGNERVCNLCSKTPEAHKLIESNKFENWRNQAGRHYARKKQKIHVRPIPILLKGNMNKLSSRVVDGKIVKIELACAFDSVAQLFLTAAAEQSPVFHEGTVVAQKDKNLFMKFIYHTVENGITDLTFFLRFKLLEGLFGITEIPNQRRCARVINCVSMIDETCEGLLLNLPSFHVLSTCVNECVTHENYYVLVRLLLTTFLRGSSNWDEVEREVCPDVGEHCHKTDSCMNNCRYLVENNFVLLETLTSFNTKIKLHQIPKAMKLSMMEEPFHLRGIVNFTPPEGIDFEKGQKQNGMERIGHYSAFCINNDDSWTHYDSVVNEYQNTHEVLPNLILYTK